MHVARRSRARAAVVAVLAVACAWLVLAPSARSASTCDHSFTLSANPYYVQEGSAVTITVTDTQTNSGASCTTGTVDYATADGTAHNPGDYTSTHGTLTFPPASGGGTSTVTQTFTVPTIDNKVAENDDLQFAVNLSNPQAPGASQTSALGAIPSANVIIRDVDQKPTVATGAALHVTSSSASLTGTVNPKGTATGYAFQYGTTTAYSATTPVQSAGAGSSDQTVYADVSTLAPNTTYHFRIVATNQAGTSTGADQTFTTGPVVPGAPLATTGPATAVKAFSATLNASVNPNGAPTTFIFQYGLDSTYGHATPVGSAGFGTTPQAVTAALDGLSTGRTYHYRVVATNGVATTFGTDSTFRTGLSRVRSRRVTEHVTPRHAFTAPFRYLFSGGVDLGPGVTSADGCNGRVTITIKRGKRTVYRRSSKLNRACAYQQFASVKGLKGKGRLRATARFVGNRFAGARSSKAVTLAYG